MAFFENINGGLTASTLNLRVIGSGQYITNLGWDINGNVVSGASDSITPFVLSGTAIDAGGDKTSSIERYGNISIVKNGNFSSDFTITNDGTGNISRTLILLGSALTGGTYGGIVHNNASYTNVSAFNTNVVSATTMFIGSDVNGSLFMNGNTTAPMRWVTGGPGTTEKMRLTASGDVSIGTSSIYGKLSVLGTDNTVMSSALIGTSNAGGIMATVYNASQTVGSVAGIRLITRNSGASLWSIFNISRSAEIGDLVFARSTTGGSGIEQMRLDYYGVLSLTQPLVVNNALTQIVVRDGVTGRLLARDASTLSGLTNFTNTESVVAPNTTVPVNILTAISLSANTDVSIVPKGTGAFQLAVPDNTSVGGNKRGNYSVDLQLSRDSTGQVVSGMQAFGAGNSNTVSGRYASGIGYGNTSNGGSAQAIGHSNSVSGDYAFSSGGFNICSGLVATTMGQQCTASGGRSVAMGYFSISSGDHSLASGYGSNTYSVSGRRSHSSIGGGNQISDFILNKNTSDATISVLTCDTGVASAINQLVLQNDNSIRFKGTIMGKQSASQNTAAWDIDGIITRGANAGTTVLLVSSVTLISNVPSFGTPTLTANTTLGCLNVEVTGLAATNIRWIATINTTEIIYA